SVAGASIAETPPAIEAPATEAPPAEATPASEAPAPAAAETPAAETPAAETPAAETPAAEAPARGRRADEDDEPEVAPRVKPAVPGADLEVDIVPEGVDPLARQSADPYATEDDEAQPATAESSEDETVH